MLRLEFKPDPDRHITLREVNGIDEATYFAELTSAINSSPQRDLLMYVHGYNVDFNNALLGEAQLAYDLNAQFPSLVFSWPSRAELTGYVQDLDNVQYASPHFTEFMEKVTSSGKVVHLHVIAQGLGCRLVVNAISQLSASPDGSNLKIKNLIMLAPDIDLDLFVAQAKRITEVVDRTTVYVSRSDLALKASAQFLVSPRLGQAPTGRLALPGIDTVDVSDGNAWLSVLGVNSVLADIYQLLSNDLPPARRHGLKAIGAADGRYWRLQ